MRNIKAVISYRGTNYHGFQRQNNAVGIQNVIEDTLFHILNSETLINGCSRTDAGVHANEFYISFLTESTLPCDKMMYGLNCLLPDDIGVSYLCDTDMDFHARYSCKGKEYIYLIWNERYKNPFYIDLALHYPFKLDIKKMKKASEYFVGEHDFSSFCQTGSLKENNVRNIEYFQILKNESFVKFIVKGDGFLYNMVRIMVGTLISVSEGKFSPDDMESIIEKKDRRAAGRTVLPHGLYLNKVFY